MHKFKLWLFTRFFPAYVTQSLHEHIRTLERENDRLRAYNRGLETAIRNQRKIIVNGVK